MILPYSSGDVPEEVEVDGYLRCQFRTELFMEYRPPKRTLEVLALSLADQADPQANWVSAVFTIHPTEDQEAGQAIASIWNSLVITPPDA